MYNIYAPAIARVQYFDAGTILASDNVVMEELMQ